MEKGHNGEPRSDLVIIERKSLLQLLEAVSNALQSTANLEEIAESGQITDEQYHEALNQIKEGRAKLIQGIQHMRRSVESLPAVDLADRPD